MELMLSLEDMDMQNRMVFLVMKVKGLQCYIFVAFLMLCCHKAYQTLSGCVLWLSKILVLMDFTR